MPISPSDLPWWVWFICAAFAGFIALIFGMAADREKGGCLATVVAVFGWLLMVVTALIGLIRFVKWVWQG